MGAGSEVSARHSVMAHMERSPRCLSPDRECNDRPVHPVTPVPWAAGRGPPLLGTSTSGQTPVEGATEASGVPHDVVATWQVDYGEGCAPREPRGRPVDNLLAWSPRLSVTDKSRPGPPLGPHRAGAARAFRPGRAAGVAGCPRSLQPAPSAAPCPRSFPLGAGPPLPSRPACVLSSRKSLCLSKLIPSL